MRDTSIVVAELESGEWYIVASLSTFRDTQIIAIDPTTGALQYTNRDGIDLFPSESDAFRYLTNSTRYLTKTTVRARAILGYAAIGNVGLILVAKKLRASIPQLPGDDCVYMVEECQWVKIVLRNPQPLSKIELKNVADLQNIDINGMHYFCETRDITRPFPSPSLVTSPDREFVWNGWLSKPFEDLGLFHHCVVLLQGYADSRSFLDARGQQLTVALTARRSRLHPGTRYLARGLNAAFSTGNEVECEQLVWASKVQPKRPIPFSVYLWRRGTIPIWWKAEIKSTVAEAEIFVSETDTFKGSDVYFHRLGQRYGQTSQPPSQKGALTPIVCINLLRSGPGKSETILCEYFQRCVEEVNSNECLRGVEVALVNLDWHSSTKLVGEAKTVETLWAFLKPVAIGIGMCTGEFLLEGGKESASGYELIWNNGILGGVFTIKEQQRGVVRFNCADSLDRTNAASFFGAVQALVEQCRRLGLPLNSPGYSSANLLSDRGGPLPPGWECRMDIVTGKMFYIDHNTRKTSWRHPCPDEPWHRFDMSVDVFRAATLPTPISLLSDLFLIAGDIHATLYTGSKAMHSQILQLFSDDAGKSNKQYAAAQNVRITLQRRYLNVLVDNTRQSSLEMFLGYRRYKHFPTIVDKSLQVFSQPPASVLKPVQSVSHDVFAANNLISIKTKDIIWICPPAAEVVEVFIFLAQPCHVCQLLLTVVHGADDKLSPSSFDVRAGSCADDLKLILEGGTIPNCANGTILMYPLRGAVSAKDMAITGAGSQQTGSDDEYSSWLYDFEEQEGDIDFLTRVVALTFYPASPGRLPLTLGEVEVLGFGLPWDKVSRNLEDFQEISTPSIKSKDGDDGSHKLQVIRSMPSGADPLSNQNKFSGRHNMTSVSSMSLGHGLDLLTGDLPPPMEYTNTNNPFIVDQTIEYGKNQDDGWDLFSGSSIPDSKWGLEDLPVDGLQAGDELARSCADQYLDSVNLISGENLARRLEFSEAIDLEIKRFDLGLSAADRDRALVSIGRDPASVNPNRAIKSFNASQLRQVSYQLALISRLIAEDESLQMVGFEASRHPKERINNTLQTKADTQGGCTDRNCDLKLQWNGNILPDSVGLDGEVSHCEICGKRVCRACQIEKEGGLLYNHMRSTVNQGVLRATYSFPSYTIADVIICKKCCPQVILYAILLDRVRKQASLRRKHRIITAAKEASKRVFGCKRMPSLSFVGSNKPNWLINILKGEYSVAEFPYASLLTSVETADDSLPALSLLTSPFSGWQERFWKAPPSVSSVELTIMLSAHSTVSGILILVSPCGYKKSDTPLVDIWCGNWVTDMERRFVGQWDVSADVAASPNLYGPEDNNSRTDGCAPRYIYFKFKRNEECRILWLKLSLLGSPSKPSSSLRVIEDNFDLFSLNPSSSLTLQPTKYSGAPKDPPFIHAQRILVIGKYPADDSKSNVLSQAFRNMVDQPSQHARCKAIIEAEYPREGDRVVEHFVNPSSPVAAGFRLNALYPIKDVVKHSAILSDGSFLEDFFHDSENFLINPCTLYLRVSAIQHDERTFPVGCFTVPITQPTTPLYYDFEVPTEARMFRFELMGGVGEFTNESKDQSEQLSDSPLATGLSLANKIQLYYYSPASETSKWAIRSIVK